MTQPAEWQSHYLHDLTKKRSTSAVRRAWNRRIVTLPALERAHQLAAHCLALRCLGAICGPNGVGKTVALRSIESKFPTMGMPGTCVYYRAFHTDGYTRGVRDVLASLGILSSQIPMGASLQLVSKVALGEFRAQSIRLLLIDEAETLDALRGMISVVDGANQADLPLSVVFAGDSGFPKWLGQHGAGLSRTLQIDHFQKSAAGFDPRRSAAMGDGIVTPRFRTQVLTL